MRVKRGTVQPHPDVASNGITLRTPPKLAVPDNLNRFLNRYVITIVLRAIRVDNPITEIVGPKYNTASKLPEGNQMSEGFVQLGRPRKLTAR